MLESDLATIEFYNPHTPIAPRYLGRAGGYGRLFPGLSDFLQETVRQSQGLNAGKVPKLLRAPTGAGEVDLTAGGFLVPQVVSQNLIGSLYEEAVLAPLCDRRATDSLDLKLPAIDETSRGQGFRWGGVSAFWLDEGATPTAGLQKIRLVEFSPKKMIGLLVASQELVADAPAFAQHFQRAFAAELSFMFDTAIFAGTGAGQPLGILNSPALVTVPKQTGQAAATIVAGNIDSMWARLPAPCRRRAVWIVNEDADAQLAALSVAVGASGGSLSPDVAAMYAPAGAFGNETPLLKGRPVLVAEQASPLGTPGDIILADLSQYITAGGDPKTAMSIVPYFTSGQVVFRITWRQDGRPAWAKPITPANGSATRSPFVALAQR
jgi:HK97 family phage major capsid protein